jgi:hypothetical protein
LLEVGHANPQDAARSQDAVALTHERSRVGAPHMLEDVRVIHDVEAGIR